MDLLIKAYWKQSEKCVALKLFKLNSDTAKEIIHEVCEKAFLKRKKTFIHARKTDVFFCR